MLVRPKIKEEKLYTKKEILDILYNNLLTVNDYVIKFKDKGNNLSKNKYVNIALKYGYSNYRVCSLGDLYNLGLMNSLSISHKNFVNKHGIFLVIFNTLNNKPISAIFRGINEKEFLDYSINYCIYGLDLFNDDFKYGDYILITEGIYDADSIRPIFKNSVALLTSGANYLASEILSTLTNRFIIATDSDNAGRDGLFRTKKRLQKINSKVVIQELKLYPGDKDLGVMEEKYLVNDLDEYEVRLQYYSKQINLMREEW